MRWAFYFHLCMQGSVISLVHVNPQNIMMHIYCWLDLLHVFFHFPCVKMSGFTLNFSREGHCRHGREGHCARLVWPRHMNQVVFCGSPECPYWGGVLMAPWPTQPKYQWHQGRLDHLSVGLAEGDERCYQNTQVAVGGSQRSETVIIKETCTWKVFWGWCEKLCRQDCAQTGQGWVE